MSRLTNNALFNIAGFLVEFAATLVVLPYVIGKLGLAAFGMVTALIALSLMGLMLGQAATAAIVRQVSRLGSSVGASPGLRAELHSISFAIVVLSLLGLASTTFIHFFGTDILTWLNVPDEMAAEANKSLEFLKVILPLILLGSIPLSILRGREQFKSANVIKVSVAGIRLASIILFFEVFEAGIYPFVVIRTSSIVLEGVVALVHILKIDRARDVSPHRDVQSTPPDRSPVSNYVLVLTLMVYAVGNMVVLEFTKMGVGNLFGLELLGVMGAAAMAAGFVSRLSQAGALVLNPAVSTLDVENRSREADSLACRSTMLGAIFMGSVTIANLAAWNLVVNIWLGPAVSAHWLVMALIFAGQGTVSSIAPLVQSSYGRGHVFGLSLIHVFSSGVGLGVAYWVGRSGEVGFLGFVVIVTAARVIGVLANILWTGNRVFPEAPVLGWSKSGILLVWAWVCGIGSVLLTRFFGLGSLAGIIVAVVCVVVFNLVSYRLIVSDKEREFVYGRLIMSRAR